MISENWKLTSFVGYGCQWQTSDPSSDCGDTIETIQDSLITEEPYDLILTTGSRQYGTADKYAPTWQQVTARGTKIVAIADNPTVTDDSLACLSRFGASANDIAQCGMTIQQGTEKSDAIVAAAQSVPGATVVDLTDLYCANGRCPSVIGNAVVYRDAGGHLTATYAKTLAPYLLERINAAR